ncbi:putative cyclase [Vararia minispora EC-137]|uniref:Cyclase n=1 Tax=Vararia minispora EC-137 TaxID=1314806 RepID=A0ACB8QUW2_9AGAM|nr:putative cyclase [Vararia minispora EC-137]
MESSNLIDLSHPLDDNVPVYPGDPPFACRQFCSIPDTGFSVHQLSFSSHVGTHIDAPSHRFADTPTIDAIPLSTFVRPAIVIDVSSKSARSRIGLPDLRPYESRIQAEGGVMVLFRTGWDRFWADKEGKYFEHPYVEKAVAERLVELGVGVLGIDTMSPDPISEDEGEDTLGVHNTILGSGKLIAENLTNLDELQAAQGRGGRLMVCLAPLKITGCDGSPVRAFGWVE